MILFSVAVVTAAEATPEEQGELGDQGRERGEEARHRHHHHVTVDHVGELVCDHAFQLGRVEHLQDAGRGAYRGLLL
jgi:hypothetical protein